MYTRLLVGFSAVGSTNGIVSERDLGKLRDLWLDTDTQQHQQTGKAAMLLLMNASQRSILYLSVDCISMDDHDVLHLV